MSGIAVSIGGDVRNLQQAMEAGAASVKDGSQQISNSLSDIDRSSDVASNGLSRLVQKLQEEQKEDRQTSRSTRFLSGELAKLGFDAKGAAGQVAGLASAFAYGGGIAVAMEAIGLLVGAIKSVGEEAEKAAKRNEDALQKMQAKVNDAYHDFVKLQDRLHGTSEAEILDRDKLTAAKNELYEADQVVKNLTADLDRAKKTALIASDAPLIGGLTDVSKITKELDAAKERQKKAQEQQRYIEQQLSTQRELDRKAASEKATKHRESDSTKRLTLERNVEQDSIQLQQDSLQKRLDAVRFHYSVLRNDARGNAAALSKIDQQQLQAEQNIANKWNEEQAKKAQDAADKVAAVDQKLADAAIQMQEDSLAKRLEAVRNFYAKLVAETKGNEQQIKRIHDQALTAEKLVENKWRDEQTKKTQDATEKQAAAYSHLGSSIGSSLAMAFDSAQGPLKALTSILQSVVQAVGEAAIKQITASAAVAGGNAAASQAGVPIIGPALAAGAMSAMLSLVLGLIGMVSAEGGYDIPAGVNPLVQTHEREMILPAEDADVIRSLRGKAGQGGGSRSVVNNYTINAMDAASFKQFLRKNQTAVVAFLDETKRAGRI